MNLQPTSWTAPSLVVSTSLFIGTFICSIFHSKKSTVISHPNNIISQQIIKKFVLTGGPCSGKTTSMEKIQVFLRERGFRVFVATEAATIMFLNGASPADLDKKACRDAFQQFVINIQMTLEDKLVNYARSTNQNCVILCDRGIMDGSAYIEPEGWMEILDSVNLDIISARDSRYDAVFHLVTCADGAEVYYNLNNNEARHEMPDEAKVIDAKLQAAWNGHPHHHIIDNKNGKTFDRKMEELIDLVCQHVGLPTLSKHAFKCLLLAPPPFQHLPNIQTFDVEKIVLDNRLFQGESDNITPTKPSTKDKGIILYAFIRRRFQGSFHSHALTTVRQLECGETIELKQVIPARMYIMLSQYADKTRSVVQQRRHSFLYHNQSFHLVEYIYPQPGLWILHCQCEAGNKPSFPPCLSIGSEIADDDKVHSSYNISIIPKRAISFNLM